ncbi:MAG TPA: hypothetical protein DCR55_05505 [Lentisphaeria bacterium]|jgi:biopolymer transport protein ExbB|nr:hypothetical protein [Lentisphaeria bacterium]
MNALSNLIWQGGIALPAILTLSFFGWLLLISKWQMLRADERNYRRWQASTATAAERATVLKACEEFPCVAARASAFALQSLHVRRDFRHHLAAYLGGEAGPLRSRLGIVRGIAVTLPSLGLLGTVLGITRSFQTLASEGNNARGLASGITQALLTTEAGLLTAVPILIGAVLLGARIDRHIELASLAARHLRRTTTAGELT